MNGFCSVQSTSTYWKGRRAQQDLFQISNMKDNWIGQENLEQSTSTYLNIDISVSHLPGFKIPDTIKLTVVSK